MSVLDKVECYLIREKWSTLLNEPWSQHRGNYQQRSNFNYVLFTTSIYGSENNRDVNPDQMDEWKQLCRFKEIRWSNTFVHNHELQISVRQLGLSQFLVEENVHGWSRIYISESAYNHMVLPQLESFKNKPPLLNLEILKTQIGNQALIPSAVAVKLDQIFKKIMAEGEIVPEIMSSFDEKMNMLIIAADSGLLDEIYEPKPPPSLGELEKRLSKYIPYADYPDKLSNFYRIYKIILADEMVDSNQPQREEEVEELSYSIKPKNLSYATVIVDLAKYFNVLKLSTLQPLVSNPVYNELLSIKHPPYRLRAD